MHSLTMIFLPLLLAPYFMSGNAAVNYCDKRLCPFGGPHIGCGDDGSFAPICLNDFTLPTMDKTAQATVVEAHNEVRQQWASGNGVLSRRACRMATIRWDNELAKLAEMNVKQCEMLHDLCHNTWTYRQSGQNLYEVETTGRVGPVNKILQNAIKSWASEGNFITEDHLEAYPNDYNGPEIGHFTPLVNERNVAVGCAVIIYRIDNWNHILVACNYATDNVVGGTVYSACSVAGSECPAGSNAQYTALCAL